MPLDQPQQSFVPKKPITAQRKVKKASGGLFFGISLIIFILAAGSAGSVYFYELYLEKKVENMRTSLERAKEAFEPSLILELKNLDARIKSAENILNNHIAFSEFFTLLEKDTLKTVRFNNFDYSVDGTGEINIRLSGEAKSYSSVALQSDIFGESKFIKNPIFSDLSLDDGGNVTFNVTADVDQELVLYSKSLDKK
ncbi:hypothetical protein ACFLY0_00690 [Patescibacteria group bacterium]